MPQRQHPSYASGPLPASSLEYASPCQACFDRASVGLALTALDGTWVWVNQRWCDLLGAPCDALQGRPGLEWKSRANQEADLAVFAPLCTDGPPPSIRTGRYLRPDGSLVRFQVVSSLVHDAS